MKTLALMIRTLTYLAKFFVMMFIMILICTWSWDAFLNGKVYSCTDGGSFDFWFVGDWVHAHDGHPVVTVPRIVPSPDMGDPDTIKQGWSLQRLWYVWIMFFGVSLVISLLFAGLTGKPLVNEARNGDNQ